MSEGDRLRAFEARLAELKQKMEHGLADRAHKLREIALRVEHGDEQARQLLKTESHKLRGVAGSYGHDRLTDLAGKLEQRASLSPPAVVGKMARSLADLAEQASRGEAPPPEPLKPPPERPDGLSAQELTVRERPKVTTSKGRLRVLALDDDPVTQRLLKLTLSQVGGFEATIVDSAQKALELLDQPWDVILSDAMMPDMNGREFSETARARGATMPIIILSAASPDELGWAAELQGPHAWLRKPFRPTSLVHDIAEVVEQYAR
jgi:CheY-like chemotaxis protein/HPt (histidine-containing phosphotransfer) domain-containing protein